MTIQAPGIETTEHHHDVAFTYYAWQRVNAGGLTAAKCGTGGWNQDCSDSGGPRT